MQAAPPVKNLAGFKFDFDVAVDEVVESGTTTPSVESPLLSKWLSVIIQADEAEVESLTPPPSPPRSVAVRPACSLSLSPGLGLPACLAMVLTDRSTALQ